ncbi:MAG: GxxExxY protein [Chthoniobacterales bacterium]
MSDSNLTTEIIEDTEERKLLNQLTEGIIGAAIEVHRALGPGLLESAYEVCLCRELALWGLAFERQKPIPIEYKEINLDCGYRADLVVEGRVLVELKAVDVLLPIHEAQLLSYLKLSGLDAGLLINFNERLLKNGIKRRLLHNKCPVSF